MKKQRNILQLISFLMMAVSVVYIVVEWNHIPDSIPTHFNGYGEIDGYGAKTSLFMIVLFMGFLHIVFSILEKNIETWKLSLLVHIKKNTRLYSLVDTLLAIAHLFAMLLMLMILFFAINQTNLPRMLLFFMIAGIGVPVILIFIAVFRVW